MFDNFFKFFNSSKTNTITNSRDLEKAWFSTNNNTRAGMDVTAETAMASSALFAAVALLTESVAGLPLVMYKKQADGNAMWADDHPLYPLLTDAPNDMMNSLEFTETMMLHLLLSGNCYAYLNRMTTDGGRIRDITPIMPGMVYVLRDLKLNTLSYIITFPDGSQANVAKDKIFHIRDLSMDGIMGKSRVQRCREAIGLALATEKWSSMLFGNGARPSGILSSPQNLKPEQMEMLKSSWKDAHGGDNALGVAVMDGDMKFSTLAMKNTDAQFLETRKFQILEISRIYRVPPHMIGDLEHATFSNIEHQSIEFVKYSLSPWIKRWEKAIKNQLLPKNSPYYFKFNFEGLLRGDTETRYASYGISLQNGWKSVNEVRKLEDLNPIPGGDTYHKAVNLYGDSNATATNQQA